MLAPQRPKHLQGRCTFAFELGKRKVGRTLIARITCWKHDDRRETKLIGSDIDNKAVGHHPAMPQPLRSFVKTGGKRLSICIQGASRHPDRRNAMILLKNPLQKQT